MGLKPNKIIKPITKLWKMRDGTEIRMCDMGGTHLINDIKMMKRLADKVHNMEIMDGYAILGSVNGEIASMCIEQELDRMAEDGPQPEQFQPYQFLIKEAKRRGLQI